MTQFTGSTPSAFTPRWIEKSDIISITVTNDYLVYNPNSYGLWVNDTTLSSFDSDSVDSGMIPDRPPSPFPFTRLWGFSPLNSSFLLLYHQLNDTVFAEDKWDVAVGDWVSKNISILTA